MPSLQQQAIKMNKEALKSLFSNARHIPAERHNDWKPMGEARSVLSQLTECALTPYFFAAVLKGEKVDFSDPEMQAKRKQSEEAITSVDIAEQAALKNHEMLYAVMAEVPDSELDKEHTMPWGTTATTADILFYDYWNLVYHIGQINYMQLMLGDTEMHP